MHKLGVVALTCNFSIRYVQTVGSEIQDFPELHSKVETNLDNMGVYLKY